MPSDNESRNEALHGIAAALATIAECMKAKEEREHELWIREERLRKVMNAASDALTPAAHTFDGRCQCLHCRLSYRGRIEREKSADDSEGK